MANSSDTRNPTTRANVFEALNTEREYQRRRWGYRREDGSFVEPEHGVCDFLVYIDEYMADARRAVAKTPESKTTLGHLRKVAALCVACFEQWGIEPRQSPDPLVNARDGKPA